MYDLLQEYGADPEPLILDPSTGSHKDESIGVPFNFVPRGYQEKHLIRPMFPHHFADLRVLETPRRKRICCVWHRRAGKDKCLINVITLAAHEEVGNYLYLLPEQTQARKIIWRGIDRNGFRFLDHIPDEICKGGPKGKYASEMLVELTNGSTIQIGGSDNYNSWMGTNPRGIVFSEFSLQDPMAWHYFRPILVENGGWAIFNYTVRGKNHGYEIAQIAQKNPKIWYYSLLTIEDTEREDGTPVVSVDQYLEEIDNGMPEAIAKQEFYCDWESALVGSYYGDLMDLAQKEKRIGFFPWMPGRLVYTFWDIGLDCNAVWFAQKDDKGIRLIDYVEEVDAKFSETLKTVMRKPYKYGDHFGPHDIENRNPEKETRIDIAQRLGVDFIVTPRLPFADTIESVREILPKCRFNINGVLDGYDIEIEIGTDRGVDCLRSHERVFDKKLQQFREQEVHNWASHGAGAFRTFAVMWDDEMEDDWFTQKIDVPEIVVP